MQTPSAVRSQLIELIESELEIESSQLSQLVDDDNLLDAPLYLDSVDLMQLSSACKKTFSVSDLGELSTVTIGSIVTAICSAMEQHQVALSQATWFEEQRSLTQHQLVTIIEQSKRFNFSYPVGSHVYVQDSKSIDVIVSTLVLLANQFVPIQSTANSDQHTQFSWKSLPQDDSYSESQELTLSAQLEQLIDCKIGFETSGSTGAPQTWFKTLRSLQQEAKCFQQTFGFDNLEYVTACVDIRHMYGFVWAFMLPLQLALPVCYQLGTLPSLAPFPEHRNLLILTPTLFDFTYEQLTNKTHYLVSSGAPFKGEREQKLATYIAEHNLTLSAFEVLGSTETGGIGFRTLGQHREYFTKFSDVEISTEGDNLVLRSPFLVSDQHEFLLKDKLVFINENQFTHGGRADQIFKYAGKRYSLQSIEQVLSENLNGLKNKVFFIEDSTHSKGGELIAFVEQKASKTTDAADIRAWFNQLPVPKVHFLPEFPVNELGKTTLSALKECIYE